MALRITHASLPPVEATLAPDGRINVIPEDHVDRALTQGYVLALGGDTSAFDHAFGIKSSYSVEDVLAWLDGLGGVS